MNRGTRQPAPKFKRGADEDSGRHILAMPFKGYEDLAKLARPDKAQAVLLLRTLGFDPRLLLPVTHAIFKLGVSIANPVGPKTPSPDLLQDAKLLALKLRYIADCIEGKMRWHRGPELTLFEESFLHHAVMMVEFRPRGVLRKVALSDAVDWLARAWGCDTEEGRSKVRNKIEQQLKVTAGAKRALYGK